MNQDSVVVEVIVQLDVERRQCIQAVELLRCMEEGIVMRPQDADVGSILGWGFCPFYGGLASYVDYVGAKTLEAECDVLAKKHGARFEPPATLRKMAREGAKLYA